MKSESLLHLNVTRDGGISRRQFLRVSAAGLAAGGLVSRISAHAGQLKKDGRACILVWLAGAPSQFETWDPKPGTPNGGETKAIPTSVHGLEIAEYWPKMAKAMSDVAVLRTVVGKEAAHERGTYHLQTGRRLTGAEQFPHFGSIVAHERGDAESDLPNFVSVGETLSSGFLGVQFAPFIVERPGQLPANVSRAVPPPRLNRRLALLAEQDAEFAQAGARTLADEHQKLYGRAARLMASPRLKAFELADESQPTKTAYGTSPFGQGLLVARRLVEAGVPFVEVRRGGWDMHDSLYNRIKPAAADVDTGLSQLLGDLKQRGLLDRTLVVCLGEFGRTPKLNRRDPAPGRDHWAKNFGALLAGAGVRGGAVIGKTSSDGQEVADRPVEVSDLFQTLCKALGIDASTELYTPQGRPLTIVDGGSVIRELFA
ncbi:MAG TPA: DUF1501 domain-containing protein [Planctomycetaceae bacterium]|nr:DUF1501 domain-containing protein [Planctomycetaceae bacterium]